MKREKRNISRFIQAFKEKKKCNEHPNCGLRFSAKTLTKLLVCWVNKVPSNIFDKIRSHEHLFCLGYRPQIVANGSAVTRDYQPTRVRLYVDKHNRIVQTPRTGWNNKIKFKKNRNFNEHLPNRRRIDIVSVRKYFTNNSFTDMNIVRPFR